MKKRMVVTCVLSWLVGWLVSFFFFSVYVGPLFSLSLFIFVFYVSSLANLSFAAVAALLLHSSIVRY